MQSQMPGQYPYQQQAAVPAMAYVGVGPRFLALLIDAIIVGVVIGVLTGIGAATRDAALISIFSLIGSLLAILYFFVLEATMGATLGKRLMGLRVVKEDGSPISWTESIIRNLLRIVDGLFGYLVGAIIVWNTQRRQRLGDIVAHTVVVKARG